VNKVDELVERVRLTDDEMDDAYFNPPTTIFNEFKDYKEVNRHIEDTILRKAIPIIQKAERERIRGELEEMFEPTVPMSINYEKWHAYWEKKGAK